MTPQRRCGACGLTKPWTDFWAAAHWPDGTVRRPQSRCKDCVKARKRHLRRQDPERARARDRQDWQRLMADPARRARRRETQRENSSAFRRKQAEERAA